MKFNSIKTDFKSGLSVWLIVKGSKNVFASHSWNQRWVMRMIQKHVVIKLIILNADWLTDFTSRLNDSELQNHSTLNNSKPDRKNQKNNRNLKKRFKMKLIEELIILSLYLLCYFILIIVIIVWICYFIFIIYIIIYIEYIIIYII